MAKTTKGTGEDNRQRIIDAAMTLIGERGVDKLTLAQIARACGLSKGTLYYYYASKTDLIFDIADRHMETITGALFDMLEPDGGTPLKDLLAAFFSTLMASEARGRLHFYLVREAIAGNDGLLKRFRATYDRWFEMVNETYDRLGRPKEEVAAKARFLVAAADGFILQALLAADPPDAEDIARLMLKVVGE